MRIIISPAKKMKTDDVLPWRDLPAFLEKTDRLLAALRAMPAARLKSRAAFSRLRLDRPGRVWYGGRKGGIAMEERACCKTTRRTEEEKKKLIHRLNRMEGQIRGLRGMIERDAYCTDILTQCAAVHAALHAFNLELTERHIRGCVVRELQEGKTEAIDDLIGALQRLMK